jgi:DNA-binding response OmpR family regulator
MAQRTILVVEDEDTIRHTLQYNLDREGYKVYEARTGTEALSMARRHHPDLIVLDLMLPEMTGLEVCRLLRQEMSVPILMLTAKASEVDTIVGLQVGADDYMTKPFSLNELMARITALLRGRELAARDLTTSYTVEEFGGFRFDRSARTVHVNGEEVRLAPKEFDLLSLLLMNVGKVQSRATIIQTVWGSNFFGEHKTVDVHIRWLREKFERFEKLPFRITTVFGVGYRLDREEVAASASA